MKALLTPLAVVAALLILVTTPIWIPLVLVWVVLVEWPKGQRWIKNYPQRKG